MALYLHGQLSPLGREFQECCLDVAITGDKCQALALVSLCEKFLCLRPHVSQKLELGRWFHEIRTLRSELGQHRSGARRPNSEPSVLYETGVSQCSKGWRMSAKTRYWTMHWLRVLLRPLPVLTFARVGRRTMDLVRRRI